MKKQMILSFFIVLIAISILAQTTVEVKGVGVDRNGAIEDAKRAAIEQALGTTVSSESQMQNFMLVKDVISTKTAGYLTSYTIKNEVPYPDRYEVTITAVVSESGLKADAKSLAQSLGGLRFVVIFDPRKITNKVDSVSYNYCYEKANEFLSRSKYRHVEKESFDNLKADAIKLSDKDTSSMTFAQNLAFIADGEIIIKIENIILKEEPKALNSNTVKAIIDMKIYDNCTGEALGNAEGTSDEKIVTVTDEEALRNIIAEAANRAMEKAMFLAKSYFSDWVNNGTIYELRFYGIDEDMFDDITIELEKDALYGGQADYKITNNFMRALISFKLPPTEMRRIVRTISEKQGEKLETKVSYGRQYSFAPKNVEVREAAIKNRYTDLNIGE